MNREENHKIRLKITGKCNKSCYFCHEEGEKVLMPYKKFLKSNIKNQYLKIIDEQRNRN